MDGFSVDGVSSRFKVEVGVRAFEVVLGRQLPSPREERRELTGRSYSARAYRREAVSEARGMVAPSGGRVEMLEAFNLVSEMSSLSEIRDVSRIGRRASEN